MSTNKLNTKTMRQQVYDRLREMILQAEIRPGEIVSLKMLSEDFGVSIMPIREALWQLEAEDIIVIQSNKNIHINTLTATEMKEVLRLRLLLETDAAKIACMRRPDSAIQDLEHLLHNLNKSITNSKNWTIQNSKFHFLIYSFSDSPILLSLINVLRARAGPYFSIHAAKDTIRRKEYTLHEEMFQAFAAKDQKGLIRTIRQDLQESTNYILNFL